MENFETARTNDFENWYEQFGKTIYRHIAKNELERIFNFAYAEGALHIAKKEN